MKSHELSSLATSVEAARAGDEKAKLAIYEQLNRWFENFVYKLLSGRGCSEPDEHNFDVVIAAWGAIFDKLGTLKSTERFLTWAFEIVRNEINDHLRQCIALQREVRFDSLTKTSFDESGEKVIHFDSPWFVDLDTIIYNFERTDKALRIAEGISPKFYTILYLMLSEDLNLCEIAELIGESHDNTRNTYYRGLTKLKRRMT